MRRIGIDGQMDGVPSGRIYVAAVGSIVVWSCLRLLPYVLPIRVPILLLSVHFVTLLFIVLCLATMAVVGLLWTIAALIRRRRSRANWVLLVSLGGFIGPLTDWAVQRFVFLGAPPDYSIQQFDRKIWLDERSTNGTALLLSPRQEMLADVLRHIVYKSNRRRIEQGLGPSYVTGYFKSTGRDLIYPLGPTHGFFALDDEWLLIWLNADGTVRNFYVAED